jgi:hypothetical protein
VEVSFIGGGNRSTRTNPPQVTDKRYHIVLYQINFAMSGIRTRNCSGDRYWYVPFVVSTSRGSVARSLVFFLVLCRSLVVLLFFCPFSIGHCVVCTFSIGHCVVCTSSISHCIVCLSSIGHCVVCTSSISHCVVCTSSIYRF